MTDLALNTITCGDCLDWLKTLPDGCVDAVVTDPPYGASQTHGKHLSGVTLRNGEPAGRVLGFAGMSELEIVDLVSLLRQKTRGWIVFTCEWHFMEALHRAGHLVRFGIWRKRNGAPQFTGDRPGMGWEAVAICHHDPTGIMRWNGGGKHAFYDVPKIQGEHPTAKPLPLFRTFVRDFTVPGATILDPFMGSGTTAVACIQTGRHFLGCEISPDYCAIAERRIKEAMGGPLFAEKPPPPPEPPLPWMTRWGERVS